MQNKPNFQKSQMNLNLYNTTAYEYFIPLAGQKNKPNSNPNKPNLKRAKMNINSLIAKGYRKKDDFVVRINKPNLRKAQNERKLICYKGLQKKNDFAVQKNKPKTNPNKPNLVRRRRIAKMNVNLYILKDYREKDDFAVQKNKPKTNPISNGGHCQSRKKFKYSHGRQKVYPVRNRRPTSNGAYIIL